MARVKPDRAAAPAPPWRLSSLTLGALPLLNHFLDRLQLDALLARYLPQPDRRLRLAPATALALLLRNILIGRAPVYALEEWAARGALAGDRAQPLGRADSKPYAAHRALRRVAA